MYYGKKRSRTVCIVMYISTVALLGGFEAGMIYAIKVSHFTHIVDLKYSYNYITP